MACYTDVADKKEKKQKNKTLTKKETSIEINDILLALKSNTDYQSGLIRDIRDYTRVIYLIVLIQFICGIIGAIIILSTSPFI
jgi:hypothetical protein